MVKTMGGRHWPSFAAPCLALLCLMTPIASMAAEPRIDPRFVLTKSGAFDEPGPGQAKLYVVREQHVRVGPLAYECAYLDEDPLGFLPPQTWLAAIVEPGTHRIWGFSACPPFRMNLQAGRSYLLRLREVIDENDQRTAHLLLENPALAPRVVRGGMMLSTPTEAGLSYLRRRSRRQEGESAHTLVDEPLAAQEFQDVLCERPLDQVNLRTDFGQHTGDLAIDTVSVRYRRRFEIRTSFTSSEWVGDSLEIQPHDIVQVRFGGVRFTGVNPWVSLAVRTPSGQQTVSFAALRETHGVETYNRIFAALQNVAEWSRARAKPGERSEQLDGER